MARQYAAGALQCDPDDLRDINEIEPDLDRARFKSRHIKQVDDKAVQAFGLAFQGGEQLVAVGRVYLSA